MGQSSRHVLTVEIKFDGKTAIAGDTGKVETKDGSHISHIQVDQRLDCPDYFSITAQMMSQERFVLLDAIKPGTEVEILIGYETEATLFRGEVSYVEPSFSRDEHLITLSGYDKTHRLTRGTSSRTWGDGHEVSVDVSEVASQVINKSMARKGGTSDVLSGETESGESRYEYVPQVAVNDYQFMRGLGSTAAIALDSLSGDDAGKIAFTKPLIKAEPKVVICRQIPDPSGSRLCLQADFALSTVKQVGRVEVRGWDPKTKQAILGVAEEVSEPFDGTTGPQTAGKAHYGSSSSGRVLSIVDVPVASTEEAEEIAASLFDALAMEYMTADVSIEGVPDLTAGDVVEMKQFGTRYSGKYLVEAAQHVVDAGSSDPYQTRLRLVRNAAPTP